MEFETYFLYLWISSICDLYKYKKNIFNEFIWHAQSFMLETATLGKVRHICHDYEVNLRCTQVFELLGSLKFSVGISKAK